MKKMSVGLLMCIMMGLVLIACSKQATPSNAAALPTSLPSPVATVAPPEATAAPTIEPAATIAPTPIAIVEDRESLKNTTGKTVLRSFTHAKLTMNHATVSIVSSQGTVAIADPNYMPIEYGTVIADIITISHGHPDHNDYDFLEDNLNARKSLSKAESFSVKDMTVTGIAASHTKDLDVANPTDIIYLYEVDDLRIAHFGDMGQDQLTEDQLKQLGKVDILFTRFSNMENYGASTEKTIALIKQVKPKIALALHYEPEVVDEILKKLKITKKSETEALVIDKAEIDKIKSTEYVFLK